MAEVCGDLGDEGGGSGLTIGASGQRIEERLPLAVGRRPAHPCRVAKPALDLGSLSVDEKLALIDELSESLGPDDFPRADELRRELDRRLEAMERAGVVGVTWESVRAEMTAGAPRPETSLTSYDFSNAKKNPYAKRLKKQVTIRIDHSTIDYFNGLAEQLGIPYQTLINLYLRECAATGKKLQLTWASEDGRAAE